MKPIPLPRRKTSEKDIEAYLRVRVTTLGGIAPKWSSPNTRGVFDRVVVLPGGAVWFIELKSKGGRLSKLQKAFADHLDRLGCKTWRILWSKEDIDNWLKELGYE